MQLAGGPSCIWGTPGSAAAQLVGIDAERKTLDEGWDRAPRDTPHNGDVALRLGRSRVHTKWYSTAASTLSRATASIVSIPR